jgi:uncharacterized membrane protein
MSDPVTTILPPEGRKAGDSGRVTVLIMYGLFFAAFITGITFFAAGILAYVQRDDLKGTVYEGHIRNGIEVFWVSMACAVIGWLTFLLGIGMVILFGATIWYLYRTIKGFLRALDGRAYS